MIARLRAVLLGFIAWAFYRLLSSTWTVTVKEPQLLNQMLRERRSFVLAHWHGDELALLYVINRYRLATLVSTSSDGQIMNTVVRLFGVKTARGSSTRGGAQGLRALIRFVKNQNYNCSFAVDGPKGPLHEVKPGVFEVSRLLGAPIFMAGVACDRAWRFSKSWNQTYLPKPFARLCINWGEPLNADYVNSQDVRSPQLADKLKDALRHVGESAQINLSSKN